MFYREKQHATTNAATAIDIDLSLTWPGRVRRISHAVLANNSNETVTAQIGAWDGNDFFPFGSQATVQNGDAVALTNEVFIFEGQRLRAVVTGVAAKGDVVLYASGLEHDFEGDPPPVTEVVVAQAQQRQKAY